MNLPVAELAMVSIALFSAGGFLVARAWQQKRRRLWLASGVLFSVGAFLFFSAAFTE
jgi:hypothetical protein